ncbi:Aste57867_20902 [Aphanomyces stellatus]|uniref:Aste57867_20902 protein n=1 Tax=Aphanomyces stellatus TaxID=120398 RepID=A0A485LI61_9STRA|nr:hypothetical protein As57867_020834 [Aphanomyces stellatus]VFT97579.1 Aste57867_20902 [Aphanomyces stellatus]
MSEETLSFCAALDAFQVELGADMRDAFLSPSKHYVPPPPMPPLDAITSPIKPSPPDAPITEDMDDGTSDNNQQRRASAASSGGSSDDGGGDDGCATASSTTNNNEATQTGRWTKKEHELFLEGLRLYGKSWKHISNLVVTRTLVQIRTHAQKYLQKQSKSKAAHFTLSHHPTAAYLMNRLELDHPYRKDAAAAFHLALATTALQSRNDIDQLLHDDDDDDGGSDTDDCMDEMLDECVVDDATVLDERLKRPLASASHVKIVSQLKPLAPSHLSSSFLKRRRLEMPPTQPTMPYLDPLLHYADFGATHAALTHQQHAAALQTHHIAPHVPHVPHHFVLQTDHF